MPGSRVLTGWLDRVAWASDASFYRIIPQAVVFPETVEEIQSLFRVSREQAMPLTFRAAGTSLSGQAIGSGILVCVTRGWKRCEPLEQGKRVRVGPGVIGEQVNRALRPWGRKIGPDPASIDSCMMGGILANNSSGMCCGTEHNAYRTLRGLKFILPSGLVFNSSEAGASQRLLAEAPALHAELIAIRDEIRASAELSEKIRRKYRIKNTMGYCLNAFLDFDDPVEILSHLMVGSEGTLGFIAEAELETVPVAPCKATALLRYESLHAACGDVGRLARSGAQAIELMDAATLRGEAPAALLAEYQFESETERESALSHLKRELGFSPTTDPGEQERLWKVRKSALPHIGATRKLGTTVIIEDVAVPVARLGTFAEELRGILDRNGYSQGAIFGHAKDGNLHFVISQSFENPEAISQYAHLMQQIAECVVGRHEGSLKAEHGTGRNMAPFLEMEWGKEACALMRRVKHAVDPAGLLNPGVLLNEDPEVHLKDIKPIPCVDAETDRCMECGFCEPVCPSRAVTLSPRQRIAVRREMARSPELAPELRKAFAYPGEKTCATDGMCATACPVEIDTGELVKRLRAESHSGWANRVASWIARHFAWVERAASCLGWLWRGTRIPKTARPKNLDYVYFPSCVNRVAGGSLVSTIVEVMERAGKKTWIPSDVRGHCCGLPFQSKGFSDAGKISQERMLASLERWSENGRVPVLVDASPCARSLKETCAARGYPVRILDSTEAALEVAPLLALTKIPGTIALHPVCSIEKMELREALVNVASRCAEEVWIPPSTRCCGFAGDRGFFVPELTRSATSDFGAEIRAKNCVGHVSTSTTCELAMSRATGKHYYSIWNLFKSALR